MPAWIPAAVKRLVFVNIPQFEGPRRNVPEDLGFSGRLAGVDISLLAIVPGGALYCSRSCCSPSRAPSTAPRVRGFVRASDVEPPPIVRAAERAR